MSNSTISAMMMMVGDMSSLNSLPTFNNHHIDDLGLDDDTFHSSVFEIFIPEHFDSQLWTSYEYLNQNTHKFINCTSRNYLIQGELLRFFLIVRPPAVVKARTLSQSQQDRPISFSSQILKTIHEVPSIITTDESSKANGNTLSSSSNLSSSNNNNNSNNSNNSNNNNNISNDTPQSITIVPPLPSSSQNLSFEIQMKYSPPDTKYSASSDQNSVNVTEYNPKHSYVETEMKNDYISSSKSSTSYLRANNINNNNNNNSNNIQQLNSKRFIGEVIDISTPFETYIPNRDTVNQKPNFFRLSNGDIVFPIEIPIYIRELYEDKLITLLFKVIRSKNHKQLLSTGNKLDRLLMNDTASQTSVKTRQQRTFFKQFTLIQPLKLQIQPNIIPLDNSHLVSIVVENTHPSLTISIADVNIYLFHVLSIESSTPLTNSGVERIGSAVTASEKPVPVHKQIGQLISTTNHYIGRPIDFNNDDNGSNPTTDIPPNSQHTFVLQLSSLSLQKQLAPNDGFHSKIKLAWKISTTAGQILSLYDLKVPPPSMSEIMVDFECPLVRIAQRFQVAIKITNLGAKSKQVTINIPAPQRVTRANPPIQFTSPLQKISDLSSTNNLKNIGKKSTTTTSQITSSQSVQKQPPPPLQSSTTISSSNADLKQSLNNSTNNKITTSTIGTSKYIPGSHIQFNEMTSKTLASFDDTQRNSANLICLENSIYVGDIDSKNSVCIFVDFVALRSGMFEIPNITIFDRIEQKQYTLKEPLLICCIEDSMIPNYDNHVSPQHKQEQQQHIIQEEQNHHKQEQQDQFTNIEI